MMVLLCVVVALGFEGAGVQCFLRVGLAETGLR
ncbi:hypothetical protein BOCO_0956 [Bombiscardovia coagulans]|uniref:Uncharacterized protein n=1 Tax=Bombiscardovia coagulans TaxID=686666 RepID=A0A261EUA8_9BIFI|nr:hypothetical protein BOCO_0956 [Bombiscardovia coagulans]